MAVVLQVPGAKYAGVLFEAVSTLVAAMKATGNEVSVCVGTRTNGRDPRVMRVVGIDPALAGATGFGVVDVSRGSASALHFGALKLPARASLSVRLREIHRLMVKLLEEFSPDAVAVESVFTALNMKTALKLAEVRGVVLLAAAQASIPAHSYSPREVKASVAGYGAASKQQMQQMVGMQLGLRVCPEPSDAADALAVALCHAHSAAAQMRMMEATGRGGDSARIGASEAGGLATGSVGTVRRPANKLGRVARAAAI